ncbi:Flp pilus assembly protein TadG [Agromyces sp. CF514]|uniref:pilus assembly protein TadG-related protein n=1 Tax=Agromyces sp. CF514 TaxID=1881031 RepID=UPI0008E52E25|nr:pilus assembly protein TadG-related protein [Agromyces sp. CF514]SFR69128.1 Flp pilus assembly protein TadG [Agromyces sp. CF514]
MRWLTGRLREEHGASAVLVGILLLVLVGFGAIAVDVGAMYSERAQLQNAADAGAIAAAEYCGANGGCATTAQKTGATSAALAVTGGNMLDGENTTSPLTFTADTVRVATSTPGMEHPLAAAIGFGSSDVGAAATAKWEIGTSASVVPFAIGACTVPSATGTIKVIPIDNDPCTPPAGAVPGGFGWLDDGTTSCIKDVTLLDFTSITTGNTGKCSLTDAELAAAAAQLKCTPPAGKGKSNVEKLFGCFVGRTVLVPVYTIASKCGTPPAGKAFCVEKFAAFEVLGVHTKINGDEKIDECKSGYKCSLPKDWGSLAFEGKFLTYVTVDDAWLLGPADASTRLIS